MTEAQGQKVVRGRGWPSTDRDILSSIWHLRALLPVGFYYKTMKNPRVWAFAERWIRRIAGVAPAPTHPESAPRQRRFHFPEVCVVGGGVAGLAAALECARSGQLVVLVDEGRRGQRGDDHTSVHRAEELRTQLIGLPDVTVIRGATALGIFEGSLVTASQGRFLHLIRSERIIVATGAVEEHPVFPGNDLPGVFLARGASRLARQGLLPGKRLVVEARTQEAVMNLGSLTDLGAQIQAVVVPESLAGMVPSELPRIVNGRVTRAKGRTRVRSVVVELPRGERSIRCDALVVSLGFRARDGLLRQEASDTVCGVGDVVRPGCSLEEAEEMGREAGRGCSIPRPEPFPASLPMMGNGFVCLCEDVRSSDLSDAWEEGFTSTELLKRYTTATMGPCQGAMCHNHLRSFVTGRGGGPRQSVATTARPPARPIRLEDMAAGIATDIEYRTGLHDRHVEAGARMEWAGLWKRPSDYGDPLGEYWALRSDVSIMDIGTLGKFRIAGVDASLLLDRIFPFCVDRLRPGRVRYSPVLNEAGYMFEESLVCALGGEGYYVTFTSSGADDGEAWLREWVEEWSLSAHVANQTSTLGAINVAGPRARKLLQRLTDDPLDPESLSFMACREIRIAGIPCLCLRVGFVGELSFELHHPASDSARLWDALLEKGSDLGVRPHGLDTVKLARLEKGHILIGQDTDFDTSPAKVGMDWAVDMKKDAFVGRSGLVRLAGIPPVQRLFMIRFEGVAAPIEGSQLFHAGRLVGHLTSSQASPILGHGVALGWLKRDGKGFPLQVEALDPAHGPISGSVTGQPFYDPEGSRVRA
jgi:sarcosine oxidase, subunit alpha